MQTIVVSTANQGKQAEISAKLSQLDPVFKISIDLYGNIYVQS